MKKDLKKISDELNLKVDTQNIAHDYWRANKPLVEKSILFLTTVMIPFCKRHKHYISNDLGINFKRKDKSKETKNWHFGLYKTKHDMEVFCHTSGTWIDLFILLNIKEYGKDTMRIIQVSLSSEYSDDEYTEARKIAVDNLLDRIQSSRKEHYFKKHDLSTVSYSCLMLWNPYAVKRDEDKVKLKVHIEWVEDYGDLADGWSNRLFDLSCDRHYLEKEED